MQTATRVLMVASLLSAGCSSDVGGESSPAQSADLPPGAPGASIDPVTGAPIDPVTGAPVMPAPVDPVTGAPIDPVTGAPVDPVTGAPVDPVAGMPTSVTAEPTTPVVPVDPPPGVCAIPATSQVPRLLNREYDSVVRDLLGVTTLGSQLPSSQLVDDLEGAITSTAWSAYLNLADAIASEVMAGPSREQFISCDPAMAECLQTTIETFGRKAFRRPLTAEEVTGFMSFNELDPPGTPDEVAEAILFAFLASPSFIMLPELAETQEAGAFKLSSHEVATRLSFLLWGSIPDADLNAAADADQLTTKEQILAQAQRMVQVREKAGPLLANFHRSYADITNVSHWNTLDHDATKYPAFTSMDAVNPAMMAEIDSYFAEVAFDGAFKDLFLSPVAFVNNATAPIYGLNAADFGPELERVELDPATRPGFLTRVGFLSSYSHFDSTSPILRGAYISKNIIGVDPGPPNPDAPGTQAPDMEYTSNRQYTEVLTSPPECSVCHTPIVNPPGFVLEAYDAIGGVQTTDPLGDPINTTADVMFGVNGTKTITSPLELMTELAKGSEARRLYAEKWVSYATKRAKHPDDACFVDVLSQNLTQDSYKITNLLADLSQADSVRLRIQGQ